MVVEEEVALPYLNFEVVRYLVVAGDGQPWKLTWNFRSIKRDDGNANEINTLTNLHVNFGRVGKSHRNPFKQYLSSSCATKPFQEGPLSLPPSL